MQIRYNAMYVTKQRSENACIYIPTSLGNCTIVIMSYYNDEICIYKMTHRCMYLAYFFERKPRDSGAFETYRLTFEFVSFWDRE